MDRLSLPHRRRWWSRSPYLLQDWRRTWKVKLRYILPIHFSELFSFLRVFEKSKAERSQSWRQIPSWAKISHYLYYSDKHVPLLPRWVRSLWIVAAIHLWSVLKKPAFPTPLGTGVIYGTLEMTCYGRSSGDIMNIRLNKRGSWWRIAPRSPNADPSFSILIGRIRPKSLPSLGW